MRVRVSVVARSYWKNDPVRRLRTLVARLAVRLARMHPAKVVLLGYASYVFAGWLALCLPFCQKGSPVCALDNLFIATSAVSTTGLVTVSVADRYTLAGQIVILLLIQAGGVGYMTFGSFVILSRHEQLPRHRDRVGTVVFSLPESFQMDKFIRSVVRFTILIEAAGALALYGALRKAGVADPLWSSIFHSVSAFCTAGFSLYNTSFEAFAANFWINAVIAALSYTGAIGFIVCVDYWRLLRGKVRALTLTSRIIVWATVWITLLGTLLILVTEPSLRGKPLDERLLVSFFQTMTAITTVGFDTVPTGGLARFSLLLIIVFMVIGASPSGTGGGLKSTTFTAILGVMGSAVRGDAEVRFWGRAVPIGRVWTAVASLGFYLSAMVVGTGALMLTEKAPFVDILFEAASGLGTVGLSMGLTPSLSDVGKLVIVLLMLCGRVGPLTFGIALFTRTETDKRPWDHDLAV